MKFSGAFSTLLVILPFVLQAAAAPGAVAARAGRGGRFGGGFGGFGGGKQGGNQNANNGAAAAGGAAAGGAAAAGAADSAAAANNTAAAGADNAAAAGGAAAGAGGDPQSSLTLDPSVIGANLAQNGLGANGTEAGQVASLTSTNNFINFCLGKTITNGLQVQAGSCNPVPMGDIPGVGAQPAAKFQFPVNMQNIEANTDFTVKMAIQNLDTGFFVNPNTNYFAAPQQLANGVIQGHSHIVIQAINGIQDTNPADPTVFAYFKGLNAAAQGGVLTADVAKGLPEGTYRLFSINTAANHQPAIGPVAQHGSFDDAVYFTVGANAATQAAQDIAAVSGQAAAAAGGAAAAGTAAAATDAAAAGTAAAATDAAAAATAAAATDAAAAATAAAATDAAAGAAATGAAAAGAAAGQNGAKGAAAQGFGKGKAFGGFGQQRGKNGRRSYSREQF